jgi:single-strand DNA-binding protein
MSTSRSLNKVILIGNLTRDPVIRETTNGSVVCTFGLATNSTWKDSKGNVQERTEFHNIVAWNKLGEICAQLLSTGMAIYAEGELRTRTWDDTNGVRHFRTEVKLQDMKLLDDKSKKGVGIENAKKTGDKLGKEGTPEDDVVAIPVEKVLPVVTEADDAKQEAQADAEDLF